MQLVVTLTIHTTPRSRIKGRKTLVYNVYKFNSNKQILFMAMGFSLSYRIVGNQLFYIKKSDNWIQYDLPKYNENTTMNWSKISYGDGKFVIVSNTGDVDSPKSAYSVNGINWTNNDLIFKAKLITYGDGYFMCIDTNTSTTQIAYSNNGINWGL